MAPPRKAKKLRRAAVATRVAFVILSEVQRCVFFRAVFGRRWTQSKDLSCTFNLDLVPTSKRQDDDFSGTLGLQIDDGVAGGLRAADEKVAGGGRLERLRIVSDRA
jgi:hypothetical protein